MALIISIMCKSSKNTTEKESIENKVKLTGKTEEKVSRIENDNGVAIVEIEKKGEIIVETNNDEDQSENIESLVENTEEKLEDKSDEKDSEKPVKETVTIPKIVQPLT